MAAAGIASKLHKSWKYDSIRELQETAYYTQNSHPDSGIISTDKGEFPCQKGTISSGRERKKERREWYFCISFNTLWLIQLRDIQPSNKGNKIEGYIFFIVLHRDLIIRLP